MKKITKYIVVGFAALALVGCKDKMRELNTDPGILIGSAEPERIFSNVLQNLDLQDTWSDFSSTGVMMQYFVPYEGAEEGFYCQGMSYTAPGTSQVMYDAYYNVGKQMIMLRDYITKPEAEGGLSESQKHKYNDLKAMSGIVEVFYAFRAFENFGAAVYTQAFQSAQGIQKPEYDVFDDVIYENLDDKLKSYIAVLAGTMSEGTFELGLYDPIYGYVAAIDGPPTLLDDYAVQRNRWKQFGNSIRLDMAWRMSQVPSLASNLDIVLSETLASGLFQDADDSAITKLSGPEATPGGIYSSQNGSYVVSTDYSVSDNFVSYLKSLDDPRLPLLARVNSLYPDNEDIIFIQDFFPETFTEWDGVNWLPGQIDLVADPEVAFQGQTASPFGYDKNGPGEIWGVRRFEFRFKAPGYIEGNADHNKTLLPWVLTNDAGKTHTFKYNSDTTIVFDMASRPQGRYFVSMGGSDYNQDDMTYLSNGKDGPTDKRSDVYYTAQIYTYIEQCYLLSYLTLEGKNTGKTASQWYELGVRAAMQELYDDAMRCEVQTAENTDAEKQVVGINDNDTPYTLMDKVDAYIAQNGLSSFTNQKEAIVGQMWIYSYKNSKRMWNWRRMTGYPVALTVNTVAQRDAVMARRIPYFVQPTTRVGNGALEFPRRNALKAPNTLLNEANYNVIKSKLVALPNFGSNINATTGRIFWDLQGL